MIKQSRKQFESNKSELISLCNLMCMYFSFLNEKSEDKEEFGRVEALIEQFCNENSLQVKPMKEIHFLCLQLEKMMQDDIIVDKSPDNPNNKSFARNEFEQPNEK
jgi:hypothetical protein